MNYKKYLLFLLPIYLHLTCLNLNAVEETISNVEKWDNFIEKLYQQSEGETLTPFSAVKFLVNDYLWQIDSQNAVLDIGCEIGKNAICLIEAGHRVVLLDIAPKAIFYTQENLKKLNLDHGIAGTCNTAIEMLDSQYGPFKAVVGTYVFPFIHPDMFQQVMKENVFDKIEVGGYFAGGFFGPEHSWAKNPALTIMTREELEEFFASMDLSICFIEERKDVVMTVAGSEQLFHTFIIVAQRIY
jgi:SAM-dependent methyltransferase